MARLNTTTYLDIESEIRTFGLDLWKRIADEVPGLFNKSYWQGLILDWAMRDPSFKIDMFRLVDVLPSLSSTEQVSQHVRELLLRDGRELPGILSAAVKLASGGFASGIAARSLRSNVLGLAERFIIGKDASEAIGALGKLRKEGFAFTVDLLGEATVSDGEATMYQNRYLDLIDRLSEEVANWPGDDSLDRNHVGPIPRANVSVKVSAMAAFLDAVDPVGSVERLRQIVLPLVHRARERNVAINLDLEQWSIHGITFDLFESIAMEPGLRDWPHVGVVVQAYLKDSRADIERLIGLARRRNCPLAVRLVKGAYWEYEVAQSQQSGYACPVFIDKAATDAQYESLTALILENINELHPAFASHNLRSLTHAIVLARQKKIPSAAIELQMLYGMAEPERKAFRSTGHRVRIYCPVGEQLPGVAYLVRRLLENTSNSGFLRLSHHEHVDMQSLMKAPEPGPAQAAKKLLLSGDPSTAYECCALTDFTDAAALGSLTAAVARVRESLPLVVPVVVDGRDRATGGSIDRSCPSDPSVIVSRVTMATAEEADRAATVAYGAFPAWRDLPVRERAILLDRLGDLLEQDRHELAALQVWEVAKPFRESDADVAEAIDFCRYYARQAMIELSPRKTMCVTGAAALVAGNPVILKPSGLSSAVAYSLYQRMMRAGFSPQVVQLIPGSGQSVGMRLVEHPLVAQIAFTGSKEVGLSIIERAAKTVAGQPQVRRVVCEMGGKNAIIVDDDADLDEAVAGVMKSVFGFAGQKCSACSRVVVVGGAYEAFVRRLTEACRSMIVGAANEPSCQLPPVADPAAQQRLLRLISDPPAGATVLFKGQTPAIGWFIPPTVFAVESDRHPLMQEELFAPIVAVMKADTFSQAIDTAMGTQFFLTGGVFSRSPAHLDEARSRFGVGNLYLNRGCTGAIVGRQPFGGFGMSGIGTKAGGPGYLLFFADPRSITENTMRRGMTPDLTS
ncbi:MAG: proline dehydrogenase family protein [Planctomycetota bacterium]|nr:proline dehydrogenase family protein [Planctomycetota bacterium]